MTKLKRQRAPNQRIITNDGRLWGYARKKPADFSRSDAFKYIYTCADRLVKHVPSASPKYRLCHNEENTWYPSERSKDSFPDAYLCRLEDDGQAPTWTTIAVCGAYALSTPEEFGVGVRNSHPRTSSIHKLLLAQNMKKIVYAMANCIRDDPRRRFTYGYTIEGSDMRLWYCDRARIVTTQSFDFTSVSSIVSS